MKASRMAHLPKTTVLLTPPMDVVDGDGCTTPNRAASEQATAGAARAAEVMLAKAAKTKAKREVLEKGIVGAEG